MMYLPGSYQQGFAPRDFEPRFPSLWRGRIGSWAACLGQTGLILRDWSCFANHLTLTGMLASDDWVLSGGRIALDLDGNDDYLLGASRFNNTAANLKSVVAWIRANSFDGQFGFNDICGTDVIGGSRTWVFATSTSNGNASDASLSMGVFSATGASLGRITSSESLLTNTWYCVAASYDGGTSSSGITLYVNGVPQTTTDTSSGTFTAPSTALNAMAIGRRSGNGGFDLHWNGQLDDIAIYDRVLNAWEFALLALRRGIAYEPRIPTYPKSQQSNRRRRLLTGMV